MYSGIGEKEEPVIIELQENDEDTENSTEKLEEEEAMRRAQTITETLQGVKVLNKER